MHSRQEITSIILSVPLPCYLTWLCLWILPLTECIHGLLLPPSTISLNLRKNLPGLTWQVRPRIISRIPRKLWVWRFVFAFVSVSQLVDGSISSQASLERKRGVSKKRDDALRASTVIPRLPKLPPSHREQVNSLQQIWIQDFLSGASWSQLICPQKTDKDIILERCVNTLILAWEVGEICVEEQMRTSQRWCHKMNIGWSMMGERGKQPVARH